MVTQSTPARASESGMGTFFNEMLNPDGSVRGPYAQIHHWVGSLDKANVERALKEAEAIFRRLGITFAVYGSNEGTEKLIPFCVIPRIISAAEWRWLSRGIEQLVALGIPDPHPVGLRHHPRATFGMQGLVIGEGVEVMRGVLRDKLGNIQILCMDIHLSSPYCGKAARGRKNRRK
jgi:hypothetical protein